MTLCASIYAVWHGLNSKLVRRCPTNRPALWRVCGPRTRSGWIDGPEAAEAAQCATLALARCGGREYNHGIATCNFGVVSAHRAELR